MNYSFQTLLPLELHMQTLFKNHTQHSYLLWTQASLQLFWLTNPPHQPEERLCQLLLPVPRTQSKADPRQECTSATRGTATLCRREPPAQSSHTAAFRKCKAQYSKRGEWGDQETARAVRKYCFSLPYYWRNERCWGVNTWPSFSENEVLVSFIIPLTFSKSISK